MSNAHIDRKSWVERHDPRFREMDCESPVTLGNGNFAFTADVTGLQTLYGDYASPPLCTMSSWGWHTTPNRSGGRYLLDDVQMEHFTFAGRDVRYPVSIVPGDEECYEWLRKNPHRFNLMRVGFSLRGQEIGSAQICSIEQRLHMYDGYVGSRFRFNGADCRVLTCVDSEHDTLAVRVDSDALTNGLCIRFAFPYADYHIAGSLWDAPGKHATTVFRQSERQLILKRRLDHDVYFVHAQCEEAVDWSIDAEGHVILLSAREPHLSLTIHLAPGMQSMDDPALFASPAEIMARTARWWHKFWEEGGAVQLNKSADPRAIEIERRIVQSLYLQAVHAAGSIPPQETGLLCNSWYGKPHGEMYLWHCAHFPLWNHPELLERSLQWYLKILPAARENAARNGYEGARWPKMADPDSGFDGPSWISPLLIWQQPHLTYMLRLYSQAVHNDPQRLRKYWPLIRESADFMASFPVRNEESGQYELLEPLLPSDEVGEPMEVRNPSFELGYWKFGLRQAMEFATLLGEEIPQRWREVEANLRTPLKRVDGYLHYEISPEYRDRKSGDRVIPIALCGLLPGRDIDFDFFRSQYTDALKTDGHVLQFGGWFRGNHAMTETRLGLPDLAVDSLLTENSGDSYVAGGYNCLGHENVGTGMQNLPVYFPGNGGLLLAIPMMAVGYPGSRPAPGFPDDGKWIVETDGVFGFPF